MESKRHNTSRPVWLGVHGEPIAQNLEVGTYLVPNNLSSNAHGNGSADPNIMIPAILEGVPRLIVDVHGMLNTLLLKLQARAE